MKIRTVVLEEPIDLKCYRCSNEWTYKGKNPYFACCTYCKAIISIKKYKRMLLEEQEEQQQKAVDQDSTHNQLPSDRMPITAAAAATTTTNATTNTTLSTDNEGGLDERYGSL